MRKALNVEAPAKINLHLRILGKRGDGYHDLESVFLALAWGDSLEFEALGTGSGCEILLKAAGGRGELFGGGIAPGENLVERAQALFRAETGFDRALRVVLVKRIPLGAGLGGASSDAAATLLALDALAGTKLPAASLHRMALALGSDVPFFLSPGAAFVRGRGDVIEPLEPPENVFFVLVNPGFPSGTAAAYRLLDEARAENSGRGAFIPREALVKALTEAPEKWPYGNDFLELFLRHGKEPEREAYGRLIHELMSLGARFALLSGSGSSCFGVFTDKGEAEKAKKRLSFHWKWVELTFPLARSPLED